MNKLELLDSQGNEKTGGFSFKWDDLNFMQEGLLDAIKGILSPVGNCILSGCEVSEVVSGGITTYTLSEGYVYYEDEIHYISTTSVGSLNNSQLYISLGFGSSYVSSGNRATQSGAYVSIHTKSEITKSFSIFNTPSNNMVALDSIPRYENVMASLVASGIKNLRSELDSNDIFNLLATGWMIGGNSYIIKDGFGNVSMFLELGTTGGDPNTILTLPIGWRPINTVKNIALRDYYSAFSPTSVEANISGSITIETNDAGTYYINMNWTV